MKDANLAKMRSLFVSLIHQYEQQMDDAWSRQSRTRVAGFMLDHIQDRDFAAYIDIFSYISFRERVLLTILQNETEYIRTLFHRLCITYNRDFLSSCFQIWIVRLHSIHDFGQGSRFSFLAAQDSIQRTRKEYTQSKPQPKQARPPTASKIRSIQEHECIADYCRVCGKDHCLQCGCILVDVLKTTKSRHSRKRVQRSPSSSVRKSTGQHECMADYCRVCRTDHCLQCGCAPKGKDCPHCHRRYAIDAVWCASCQVGL